MDLVDTEESCGRNEMDRVVETYLEALQQSPTPRQKREYRTRSLNTPFQLYMGWLLARLRYGHLLTKIRYIINVFFACFRADQLLLYVFVQ